MYGKELIIDLHDCDVSRFNREDIALYIEILCEKIDMQREDLYFWDYEDDLEGKAIAPPHLKGTSCVQFISTSTVVVHTLDDLKKVFINIFSCKDFDSSVLRRVTMKFFSGVIVNFMEIERI